MTDTLSPTTDPLSADLRALQQQSAYQRLLLAEMGITPWVGQTQPVQIFSTEAILDDLISKNSANHSTPSVEQPQPISPTGISQFLPNRPIENANIPPSSIANLALDNSSSDGFQLAPTNLPTISEQGNLARLDNQKSLQNTFSNHAILPSISENTPLIRCRCYVLKIQHWAIVADANVLNAQPATLQLWQNIIQSTSGHQYEFRFPLLAGQDNPMADGTPLLAQASFAGFLCLVERGSHLDTHEGIPITKGLHTSAQTAQKVGIVTPLPDCLENDQIRRLPYLTEMLEDYRQKRQFWQLIIANEAMNVT